MSWTGCPLETARSPFSNAYSREKKKSSPKMDRIDNYYARFQLQKAVMVEDAEIAFRLFDEGSRKLMLQIFSDETKHYPFKVGRIYTEIFEKYFRLWNVEQISRFYSRCVEIRQRAQERPKLMTHREVIGLVHEIGKLLPVMQKEIDKAKA
jgi:Zn-dependent oligopeptidase